MKRIRVRSLQSFSDGTRFACNRWSPKRKECQVRELIRQTIERARAESPNDASLRLAAELIRLARVGSTLHRSQAAGLIRAQAQYEVERAMAAESER